MLLVLDNCEHVLDAAADLVDAIVAGAPEVHVVVTSREPLGLEGEQVRRIQSLGLPEADDPLAVASAAPAIRLFEERARAASDGFRIDPENLAAVVEICRHLDGIPLAIELAAARSRSMAPTEIARRLDERFRLLSGGSRRAQERHRTLFATVSWSHDLLDDDDKTTFRRLSVFPASFDLDAAESVVGAPHIDVVDSVLRLVDRSLVAYEPVADRYRLLETLRQYGADRLVEADEVTDTRARHAHHFLAVAERLEPILLGRAITRHEPRQSLTPTTFDRRPTGASKPGAGPSSPHCADNSGTTWPRTGRTTAPPGTGCCSTTRTTSAPNVPSTSRATTPRSKSAHSATTKPASSSPGAVIYSQRPPECGRRRRRGTPWPSPSSTRDGSTTRFETVRRRSVKPTSSVSPPRP